MQLNDIEQTIMEFGQEHSPEWFMYWSSPTDATNEQARADLIGTPIDEWDVDWQAGEFVPFRPLDWSGDIIHGSESLVVLIGGVGSGKTLQLGAVGVYYCCMMPNFRFLSTAPVYWQSEQMLRNVKEYIFNWDNREARPRRILKFIEKIVMRPYPKIIFKNGSTMEFMSVDKNGDKIMTWSGDMIVLDQAEQLSLEEGIMQNLGSRMRGQVDGRPRLNKFVLLANSAYNPHLWFLYDQAAHDDTMLGLLVTSYDNFYLSESQLKAMARNIGDPEEVKRLMMSERPLPKGKEFQAATIAPAKSKDLDDMMSNALSNAVPGWNFVESTKAGVIEWSRPYVPGQKNILVSDPGQSNPPYRNSAVSIVIDVQGLPHSPATLVAFKWIYGNASYWPWIYNIEEYYDRYKPVRAGYDATGTQKGFDELVLSQRGPHRIFEKVDFTKLKMHMVNSLKIVLSGGMLLIPTQVKSLWSQLLEWHMPDKTLRQDIASAMFMAGWMVHRHMLSFSVENDTEKEEEHKEVNRRDLNRMVNRRRLR